MKLNRRESRRKLVVDAREVVDACAGVNIRLLARQVSRFLEERMRKTDLSLAQFGLMTHIAATSDDTVSALVQRTGLEQSTLSRNLRALEKRGLIEIAIVEQDLRKRSVWLTESGARRLEVAMPAWKQAHADLSAIVDSLLIAKLKSAAAEIDGQLLNGEADLKQAS